MKKLIAIFLIILSGTGFGQKFPETEFSLVKLPGHQLRIYEIPKENRQVFLDRLKIMPLE